MQTTYTKMEDLKEAGHRVGIRTQRMEVVIVLKTIEEVERVGYLGSVNGTGRADGNVKARI